MRREEDEEEEVVVVAVGMPRALVPIAQTHSLGYCISVDMQSTSCLNTEVFWPGVSDLRIE